MIYPKYYTSVSDDIFNTAYDEQIYSLGDVVLNQNSGSIYVQHLIFAKATFDVIKYQPYFLGKQSELIQYSPTYQPEGQVVVSPQMDIKAGQYGYVLFKGEGFCMLEDTVAFAKNNLIRAEGDEPNAFGKKYDPTINQVTVGFLTENQETGQNPVKCCLFGQEIAIPPAS